MAKNNEKRLEAIKAAKELDKKLSKLGSSQGRRTIKPVKDGGWSSDASSSAPR